MASKSAQWPMAANTPANIAAARKPGNWLDVTTAGSEGAAAPRNPRLANPLMNSRTCFGSIPREVSHLMQRYSRTSEKDVGNEYMSQGMSPPE